MVLGKWVQSSYQSFSSSPENRELLREVINMPKTAKCGGGGKE